MRGQSDPQGVRDGVAQGGQVNPLTSGPTASRTERTGVGMGGLEQPEIALGIGPLALGQYREPRPIRPIRL